MRRYASIDFLRGTAILMMIVLHIVMFMLDTVPLVAAINTGPLINIIALITLETAGGMAGFFLLVSAIGNGISMERNYQAGKSAKDVGIKQVVGGVLLLVFAVLSEGVIGYQGALGSFTKFDPSWWTYIFYRGYHMETIHTIAWCVIVNGIVQWVLARKDGWKKSKRNIKIYVILAILVLVLTPLMWEIAAVIVPGYPYARYIDLGLNISTLEIKYPLAGYSSFWDYIILFLLAPLASSVEPIFPYLAISFVGSIIGILLTQKREEIPRNFPRKIMRIGIWMFVIGAIGFVLNIVLVPDPISAIQVFYDHRYFSNIGLIPTMTPHVDPAFSYITWLFQFMFLNGIGICLTILIIRLVEFRGKAAKFAKQTLWVRRYGLVAFSMYNYQELYFLPWFIVTVILQAFNVYPPIANYGERGNLPWLGVFVVIGLSLLLFEVVLRLWEKADFMFGLEWFIGIIGRKILPVKKQTAGERVEERKWWQVLDAKSSLHDVEWLNIVEENEVPHDKLSDSRLAYKISWWGLLLFPAAFMAYGLVDSSSRTEQPNKYNKRAKIIAIVGIIFFLTWFILMCFLSLADLGIAL